MSWYSDNLFPIDGFWNKPLNCKILLYFSKLIEMYNLYDQSVMIYNLKLKFTFDVKSKYTSQWSCRVSLISTIFSNQLFTLHHKFNWKISAKLFIHNFYSVQSFQHLSIFNVKIFALNNSCLFVSRCDMIR